MKAKAGKGTCKEMLQFFQLLANGVEDMEKAMSKAVSRQYAISEHEQETFKGVLKK